ncbi:MAG: class I SAM-dependent methyltransferase [Defluviitaleaceae bacterium]|nr:class I SAM-dependent methyltransferase [Defluviitaleaceae bacterium]
MVASKGWDWENGDKSSWLKPAEDCVFLASYKWKELRFRDVLDLGCGLGRHAMYFARQGFRVSAMDMSEYGVEHVKSWAGSENLTISSRVGDMHDLPYPDGSFDGVFTYHVINHTDTAGEKRVISEIKRVLRPGGEAFLTFGSKESDFAEFQKRAGITRVDENTVIMADGLDRGSPHFFVDFEDILVLLADFTIEKIRKTKYFELGENPGGRGSTFYVSAVVK